MGSISKRMRWLREILCEGYYPKRERSGHISVRNASGKKVYSMPSTPSDNRSDANAVSDLRRIGAARKKD